MTVPGPLTFEELERFLQELEALAPHAPARSTSVAYRRVADEEIVDDSLSEEPPPPEEGAEKPPVDHQGGEPLPLGAEAAVDLVAGRAGPVAAVDTGIVRLGETENGLVIALRSTLVSDSASGSQMRLVRSGPIYLHNDHKLTVLHQVGRHLGREDLFVELDLTDRGNPRPIRVKAGVADDSHQYGDRFRNWLERLVQQAAVTVVENGIVLLDGALTLRTRDTPRLFVERLAEAAGRAGNALIGISKQSRVQIRGRAVRFWLNDVPNHACYRRLTDLMDQGEGAERILGNLYAVRFSPAGPTFRVDVMPPPGQSDQEAIQQLQASALMRGGYPDILVRAHTFSFFTSPDVLNLQAQAGAMYRLVPQPDVDLAAIFGPFGGRFK